jgi:excisionase family DNA binding protein
MRTRNPPAPRPLTLADVCERLGCGWQTAYGLVRSGALPSFRVTPTGRYRIYAEDLDRYIEARQVILPEDGGS